MNRESKILKQNDLIDGKYKVKFFLKKGKYAESYSVTDEENRLCFLKLFQHSKLHKSQFDELGEPLEIELIKSINHPNIVKYLDSGVVVLNGQKFSYLVLDFISGETLADRLKREEKINPYDAKEIILGVLNGLKYLHSQQNPIIHNEITNLNVMLDLSGKLPIAKIIDFGYARFLSQSNRDYLNDGLNPFYLAPESFNNVFSAQSDLYSVGALYYHLLFGLPPWFFELSKYKSSKESVDELLIEERSKPLKLDLDGTKIEESTKSILKKALSNNVDFRFKSSDEFISALNGEMVLDNQEEKKEQKTEPKAIKKGKGFSAIAGMQELKDTIKLDVIDALNDKEKYEKYGLTIPNGMLLYGPPGCGKTFFAERMAEEIGFNFYQIKPSDIQSKWVNASQENIKNLFDEARDNAPSIIFIDELDALVPDRSNNNVNHMNTSAVNEFLSQMNNCGEEGVFIVGATNRPDAIDPAIMRAGRLDKHIYLPPPDDEARELMFKLYLEKRPTDLGINYKRLADATVNYVSSDIKFLCDEASRQALKNDVRISEKLMLETITRNSSSISSEEILKYIQVKKKMDGELEQKPDRPSIGFKK